MIISAFGTNFRCSPLEFREKLSVPCDKMDRIFSVLAEFKEISESVFLTTCNRTELYMVCPSNIREDEIGSEFFGKAFNLESIIPKEYFYSFRDLMAIQHLFKVTSSLDSMVIGESQILGQVKQAYQLSQSRGLVGKRLNQLFQRSIKTAKRIRTETGIARMPISISSIAVDLAKKIWGELSNCPILLVGTGEMGALVLKHLRTSGAKKIYVTSRSYENATNVSLEFSGTPVPFEEMLEKMIDVDIIVTATDSPSRLISKAQVENILKKRNLRPLTFIDIAVPRDVDPEVGKLDNAFLYHIDTLEDIANKNLHIRQEEINDAMNIISEERAKFANWLVSLEAEPTIKYLEAKWEAVCSIELKKTLDNLPNLTDEQKAELSELLRRLGNRFLSNVYTELKSPAESIPNIDIFEIVHRLFNL